MLFFGNEAAALLSFQAKKM